MYATLGVGDLPQVASTWIGYEKLRVLTLITLTLLILNYETVVDIHDYLVLARTHCNFNPTVAQLD